MYCRYMKVNTGDKVLTVKIRHQKIARTLGKKRYMNIAREDSLQHFTMA